MKYHESKRTARRRCKFRLRYFVAANNTKILNDYFYAVLGEQWAAFVDTLIMNGENAP